MTAKPRLDRAWSHTLARRTHPRFPLTPLAYVLICVHAIMAEHSLGTQGDVWDTQWDMALALTGAIVSQLLLSRVHTAQLGRLVGVERQPLC